MFYRSVLSVLFLVCMLASAKSQSFFDGFGIKGGLSVATIHQSGGIDLNTELTPKTFFHGGVYKDFWLDLNWSIRAEVLYSAKGAQSNFRFIPGAANEDVYVRADYLSVPVLAQFARGNFKFGAGPQFGLLLGEHVFTNGGKSEGILYDNTLELGMAGNITYTLLMIDIDLRYVYGLTRIDNIQFTDPNGSPISSGGLHNGALQLSLGLRIF